MVELQQATPQDYPAIFEILYGTALWLKEKNSKQWNGILEGKDNHHTEDRIGKGEVFYFSEQGEMVGICLLLAQQSQWDDELWGKNPKNNSFYLHRFTIARKYSGQGFSAQSLQKIKEYAKKEKKKSLRLDCLATNDFLNQMYQKQGFTFLKTIKEHDAGEQIADFNLYEWQITDL